VSAPRVTTTDAFRVHLVLAGTGLLAAVVLRVPLLVALVTPSVLLVAVALAWRAGPGPKVTLRVDDERLLAGSSTTAHLAVTTPGAGPVEVELRTRAPLVADDPRRWTCAPGRGATWSATVALDAPRWGAGAVGPVELRWASPGGLREARATHAGVSVRVLPHTPPAEALVRPLRTHRGAGNQRADDRGSGTEFADLRPFVPGDRARDTSPRTSARRGQPWVVTRHPERRTDVVLLLDATDADHLDDVLRAARSLARGYLAERDRVGVTTLAGVLRWVAPGDGRRHEHRLAEALLDARAGRAWARPAVEGLPPRALPPGALLLAVTPGSDPHMADVVVGLRARGRDVAVLVLDPPVPPVADPAVPRVRKGARTADPRTADADDPAFVDRATLRLLRLQRRAVLDRLHANGVAAVGWDPATPVESGMVALGAWRRRARVAR